MRKSDKMVKYALEMYISKCMDYLNGRVNPTFPCVHYSFYYGPQPKDNKKDEMGEEIPILAWASQGIIVFFMDEIMDTIFQPIYEPDDYVYDYMHRDNIIDLNLPTVKSFLLQTCVHELAHMEQIPLLFEMEADEKKKQELTYEYEQSTNAYTMAWLEKHRYELYEALGYFYEPEFIKHLYYGGYPQEKHADESLEEVMDNYCYYYRTQTPDEWSRYFIDYVCVRDELFDKNDNITVKISYKGKCREYVVKENGKVIDFREMYPVACLIKYLVDSSKVSFPYKVEGKLLTVNIAFVDEGIDEYSLKTMPMAVGYLEKDLAA